MTREEAGIYAELLKAYSEGKVIQMSLKNKDTWLDCVLDAQYDTQNFEYRIKPEQKYRPYANAEEFLKAQKEHGPYIKSADRTADVDNTTDKHYILPIRVREGGIYHPNDNNAYMLYRSFQDLFTCFVWQDDTPCSIKV